MCGRAAFVAGAIVLFAASPAWAGPGSSTVEKEGPIEVGQPAPTFGGWLGPTRVALHDLLDSPRQPSTTPVVISYFATWCEPCKKGLPVVAKLQEETGARTMLIAVGQRPEEFNGWLKENRLNLPAIADPFMKISERWGVDKKLPRTFVLDSKGRVRTIFVLEGDDFEAELREAIAAARIPMSQPIPQAGPIDPAGGVPSGDAAKAPANPPPGGLEGSAAAKS